MKRKAKGQNDNILSEFHKAYGRQKPDKRFFKKYRDWKCFFYKALKLIRVQKLDKNCIRHSLNSRCPTIEHQIIELRKQSVLTDQGLMQRRKFTEKFLDCLQKHHGIIYEGLLFGSTINGLGFHDSDVDLRLRPLKRVGENLFEPVIIDSNSVEKTLRDIAFQTTKCCPAIGNYVPSTRCPIAKLTFLSPKDKFVNRLDPELFDEGINFDISLSTGTSLGTFNSLFIRFLNNLEPKFHLLATVIRYWSSAHKLIVPGYLSSYALINMLIFFCQTIEPPLLPSVDHMRELYLKSTDSGNLNSQKSRSITQMEWNCLISLDRKLYAPSTNTEPLSVLLLKFFEFYLSFPYSTQIITTRPGRSLSHEEFKTSPQFHPKFPIKSFLNIQDPFDLTHNLTSGMQGAHFRLLMVTIRFSYERLFKELLNRFCNQAPRLNFETNGRSTKKEVGDWGLSVLFIKLSPQELKNA